MKRQARVFMLTVGIMVLLQLMMVVSAETPYDSMIRGINKWYANNPETKFPSAEAQQVFEWRVGLERFDWDTRAERFLFYEHLLVEIENQQFVHNNYRYNQKSIRAKMIEDYPFWSYSNEVISPSANFANIYEWYKSNIVDAKEHLHWLRLFLSYVDKTSDGIGTDAFLKIHSESLNEICQQYIALLSNLDMSSREMLNIDYYYSDLSFFAFTGDHVDLILYPLAGFAQKASPVLTETTKKALHNFIVPDYIDNTHAVKIYAAIVD